MEILMRSFFGRFVSDQSGAVLLDWVILTASIISLTIILAAIVTDSVDEVIADIESQLVE